MREDRVSGAQFTGKIDEEGMWIAGGNQAGTEGRTDDGSDTSLENKCFYCGGNSVILCVILHKICCRS